MTSVDLREQERICAVRTLMSIDASADLHIEEVCRTAASLFGAAIAIVTLVDGSHVWIKAAHGVVNGSVPRAESICDETIVLPSDQALVLADLKIHPRFKTSASVVGFPYLRFYAGVPITTLSGCNVGTLCVMDAVPRENFGAAQIDALRDLARIVQDHFRLHETGLAHAKQRQDNEAALAKRDEAIRSAGDFQEVAETAASFGQWRIDAASRTIVWSHGIDRILARRMPDQGALGLDAHFEFYHPDDRAEVRRRMEAALYGAPTGDTGRYEAGARVLRPDGEVREILIQGLVRRDATGSVTSLFGIMLDITLLARSERQARETSDLLRTTLETMDQGLVMIGPDNHVRIHNRRARTLLDVPEGLLFDGAPFDLVHRLIVERGDVVDAEEPVEGTQTGAIERSPAVYRLSGGAALEVREVPLDGGGVVRTYTDVSRRRAAEAALRESEQRLALALDSGSDGVWDLNLETGEVRVSGAWLALTGYSEIEIALDLKAWIALAHPDDTSRLEDGLSAHLEGQLSAFECEYRLRTKNGAYVWTLIRGKIVSGVALPRPLRVVGTLIDITKRKEAEQLIAHMALHDGLTGLANRTLLTDRLNQVLADTTHDDDTFAVIACDLDGFKAVNDGLGHPAGDAVLRTIATRLKGVVRDCDTVSRFGGDEFTVVLGRMENAREATTIASRIIDVVCEPMSVDGRMIAVGVSVGIATATGAAGAASLLKNADIALYKAKELGGSRLCMFETGMESSITLGGQLENDMRAAVRSDGFVLDYQPIVELASGSIRCIEALMRWHHPERGTIPPGDFIPLAERTGLIVPLGAWALREACGEAAAWPCSVRVAVNVSAVQFRQPGVLETNVRDALSSSGLPAGRLVLEITESVLVQDAEAVLASLHRLRTLGVLIALDDFGTGYSSLSYLRRFPFDKIKIDRSFVQAIEDPDTAAIVRAVVGLGRRVGAAITAEGVETARHLERVREEGCTEVQGFLFSRPLKAADAAKLITLMETTAKAA